MPITSKPMRHSPGRLTTALATAGAALALAACQTTPPRNAALDQAHKLYNQASVSPDVARGAPLELERARATLATADRAWRENRDERETAHLAYLASQHAQVAINVGMQRAADEMVTSAGMLRERARADASLARADASQQQAQLAMAQAQSAQQQAQSATERASLMQQELSQLSTRRTDQGLVVVLQDVLFDVGQATLKPGAQSRLDLLAGVLRKHPQQSVRIEGFTDSTGSESLNQRLSEERAQVVRDALVSRGIGLDRIETRGYGESRPVASNGNAAGRQQNRRVEVVFTNATGPSQAGASQDPSAQEPTAAGVPRRQPSGGTVPQGDPQQGAGQDGGNAPARPQQ